METAVLKNMVIDFPCTKNNANKLIKEYGNLAYAIALKLYRIGFSFCLLDNMTIVEALNINLKFKKAVNEIIQAKKELKKVNSKFTNKCTDEEMNSLIIYQFGGNAEVWERMLKRGISVVNNNGKFTERA